MKKRNIYICYGYGSEYVLHDLYLELVKTQETYEIEPLLEPVTRTLKRIGDLSNADVYFLTSAHPLFDNRYFNDISGVSDYFVPSPLVLHSHFHPKRSFFFAHDLIQPLIDDESPYFSVFDYVVIPYELQLHPYLRESTTFLSHEGWIKYSNLDKPSKKKYTYKLTFFLSDFKWHMNKGHDFTYTKFKPLFDAGAAVKLPVYPGDKEFEAFLRTKNVRVIPAEVKSTCAILQSNAVITNGLSSTSAEAYLLGKPTMLIRDDEIYTLDKYQGLHASFPKLVILDDAAHFDPKMIKDMKYRQPMIKPFRTAQFMKKYLNT